MLGKPITPKLFPTNPIFNAIGSTGWNTPITANGAYLTLIAPGAPQGVSGGNPIGLPLTPGQYTYNPMLDLASYYILGGSSGVGTVVTFAEMGADGIFRPLVLPAPITLASATPVNGVINGPFLGLQIVVSSLVGNGIAYAILKASVRSM